MDANNGEMKMGMTNGEIVAAVGDCVWSDINGQGRSDGYDVEVYCMGARYLVRVYNVDRGRSAWYVASTIDAAEAVGRAGYSPGSAPGAYRYVRNPARLTEIRARSGR